MILDPLDAGGYKSNIFDPDRLRRQAVNVAKVRQGTPTSTLASIVSTVTAHRKLFRTETTQTIESSAVPGPGWFLIVDRFEGWASYRKATAYHDHGWQKFEEGRVLYLAADGQLHRALYHVRFYQGRPREPWWTGEAHELMDDEVCGDTDLYSFDRLNRYSYRTARTGEDEVRRDELRRSVRGSQVRCAHPGMETSLALKRFKETGVFIHALEIVH